MEKQVRRLAAMQAEVAGYRRQWQAVTRPGTAELQARVSLYEMLVGHFNNEELMQLCFTLGVFWDRLAGDTLDGKARALIEKMEREGRVYQLVGECQRLRPQVLWPVG